jgi:rhomboid protease GluP
VYETVVIQTIIHSDPEDKAALLESTFIALVITASVAAAFFSLRRRTAPMRSPTVTLIVTGITLCCSLLAVMLPGILHMLDRDSGALLAGQWWRVGSPLLVQDGGLVAVVTNTISLLIVGSLAESLIPRAVWIAGYLVSGLVGEITAYTLLPHQGFAGNSIAILGLCAVVAVLAVLRGGAAARFTAVASIAIGTGMLAAGNLHGAGYSAGAMVGLVTAPLLRRAA